MKSMHLDFEIVTLVFPTVWHLTIKEKRHTVCGNAGFIGGVGMANVPYDKSIDSVDRSVVAGTKMWGVILGIVLLLGIGMIVFFFLAGNMRSSGRPNSENTATRPAEP